MNTLRSQPGNAFVRACERAGGAREINFRLPKSICWMIVVFWPVVASPLSRCFRLSFTKQANHNVNSIRR